MKRSTYFSSLNKSLFHLFLSLTNKLAIHKIPQIAKDIDVSAIEKLTDAI
jgi:hypothetical protein